MQTFFETPAVPDAAVESRLRGRMQVAFAFDYHWPREASGSVLGGEFGTRCRASLDASLLFQIQGQFHYEPSTHPWRATIRKVSPHAGIRVYCVPQLPHYDPDGELESMLAASELIERPDMEQLCRRIYTTAAEALSSYWSRELGVVLGRMAPGEMIADCEFSSEDAGREAFRRMRGGDLTGVLDGQLRGTIHGGALARIAEPVTPIELHLPILERRQLRRRTALLGAMRAEADGDGRILLHPAGTPEAKARNQCQSAMIVAGPHLEIPLTPSTSSLVFGNRQQTPAAEAVPVLSPLLDAYEFDEAPRRLLESAAERTGMIEAGMSLSVSGGAARSWLSTPKERSLAFYHAYVKVSTAVQRATRLWLPYLYFENAGRYENLEMALPVVVYQASKPFSRRARSEFTYEPINPRSVSLALRHATVGLPRRLERIQTRLLAAGRTDLAEFYGPKRARQIVQEVCMDAKWLKRLLGLDAFLVNALIRLGNFSRGVANLRSLNPDEPPDHLSSFLEVFIKRLHVRLRKPYDGQDLMELGSLVLVEATRAISVAFGDPQPLKAVLRLRLPGEETEHIFVNRGFRMARGQVKQ